MNTNDTLERLYRWWSAGVDSPESQELAKALLNEDLPDLLAAQATADARVDAATMAERARTWAVVRGLLAGEALAVAERELAPPAPEPVAPLAGGTAPLDLRAIEARLLATSPGPWAYEVAHWGTGEVTRPDEYSESRRGRSLRRDSRATVVADSALPADGEFIAKAPGDVAALVARVRDLEARTAGPLDLAELERTYARVTAGPWSAYGDEDSGLWTVESLPLGERQDSKYLVAECRTLNRADAKFMAVARNLMGPLLKRVRELEDRVKSFAAPAATPAGLDLPYVEALAREAVEGPWYVEHRGVFAGDGDSRVTIVEDAHTCGWDRYAGTVDFIAASRTLVPAMVEALRAANQREQQLRTLLAHALPYAYEPADQTVQCPECQAIWWHQPEALDQDWHARGCLLQAARVLVGASKNERLRPPDAPDDHYAPSGPAPDSRTPAQVLVSTVMEGWWQELIAQKWAEPPEGTSPEAWKATVGAVSERMLKGLGPPTGPHAGWLEDRHPLDPDRSARCTCGSGGHPRACQRHPWEKELHVRDLELENLRGLLAAQERMVAHE